MASKLPKELRLGTIDQRGDALTLHSMVQVGMFRVMILHYNADDCSKQDLDPDEAPQALFLMRLLLRHKPASLVALMDDADMAGLRAIIVRSPCLLTVYLGESPTPANSASLTAFVAQAH